MVLGTLSSTTPCFSQVTVSHLDICGGFSRPNGTVRESTTRERKLTDIPPQGKLAASHHPPAHAPSLSPYLPPLLEFLYVYGACEIWKTSGGAARRHTDAMIGGRPNFPKNLLPCTQIFTARCKTFLKEWVCRFSYQGEEERLIFV